METGSIKRKRKASKENGLTEEILNQSLSSRKQNTVRNKINSKNKKNTKTHFKPFKCHVCTKEFQDKYALANHVAIHSTTLPYSCDLCSFRCKVKKYLPRHKMRVHGGNRQHACDICGKLFFFKSKMLCHRRVHTGEKPHKCDICGKEFNARYSLTTHMLIHTDEKPFQCSYCSYACRDSSTLRKHQQRHTGSEKVYQCKMCGDTYKNKWKLKHHVAEKHLCLDLRKYECNTCGKSFKLKSILSHHILTVHEKAKSCKCEICGTTVSNRSNLPYHMRVHVDTRPYKCTYDGCTKTYKDSSSLRKHVILHYPERHFPCEICGAKFSRKLRMKAHLAVHLPKRKRLECDYCGVRFLNKNYIAKHIREKHMGKRKRFKCDMCGFVTRNKPSIVMHIKHGHVSETDRECTICHTKYKRHAYLKAHYARTHGIRYKTRTRNMLEIKEEPPDDISIDLLEIEKEEILDVNIDVPVDEHTEDQQELQAKDIISSKCKQLKEVPESVFNEYYIQCLDNADGISLKTKKHIDKQSQQYADTCVKKLLVKLRRVEEVDALEKTRQIYNERMRVASSTTTSKENKIKYFNNNKPNPTQDNKCTLIVKGVEELNADTNSYENNKLIDISHDKSCDETNVVSKNLSITLSNISYDKVSDACDNETNIPSNASSNKPCDNLSNILDDISDAGINDKTNEPNNVSNYTCEKTSDTSRNNSISKDKTNVLNDVYNDKQSNIHSDNKPNDAYDKTNEESNISKTCVKSSNVTNDENDPSDILNDKTDDKPNNIQDDKTNDESSDTSNDTSDDNGSEYAEEAEETDSDEESVKNKRNGKITFNTHQCYICFKLFETKQKLLDHCKDHFDICTNISLKKCPFCDFVTKGQISRHVKLVHKVHLKIPYGKLKDKKDNTEGSRYYYEAKINNKQIKEMQVIPSIKNLNKIACTEIDKKNREEKNKMVAKTKLVKKGAEWIVEKEKINVASENFVLPELDSDDVKFNEKKVKVSDKLSDDYVDRLKRLSKIMKKRGKKMLFPCDKCEKVCQTAAALKLHSRKHDKNPKPFKKKVWKHKLKANKQIKEKPVKTEVINTYNRIAKPKPITNKHKCDPELKKFYETNITGGDVEFWQFLKIFNRMGRQNINDFTDLEKTTEFGMHKEPEIKVKKRKVKLKRKVAFKRVIRISQKDYIRRNELKKQLRERIAKENPKDVT